MADQKPAAAPPIAGVSHITYPVSDLAAAEAFYVGLLGATLLRRFDRETFLRLRPDRAAEADADNSPLHLELKFGNSPEVHLFLQRGHKKTPPSHPHLAFDVGRGDLLAFQARLRAAGVKTDGPRRLGPPGHASVYFADPFGNTLEFTTNGFEGPVLEGPPPISALGGYEWPPG